jgi:drug/metabolite transporter superfamily protein YnfA
MKYLSSWIIFIVAALLEVGGDAIIRKGLRGSRIILILSGCAILAIYGIVVNTLKWDFGRLLGVYVAIFALISILFSRFVFKEHVSTTTWVGLIIMVLGGIIIQFGQGS